MLLPELEQGALVGGTALSLLYGHRRSIDLDIFFTDEFDRQRILDALTLEFGNDLQYEGMRPDFAIFCFISGVKVDIVNYPHPLISGIIEQDEIRLYSSPDISGMKMNAILGRGKKKDFFDVHELLKTFSLEEIIGHYHKKFPNQMLAVSLPQALTYFVDAEEGEDPVSLNNTSWDEVKSGIKVAVRTYLG